MPTCLDRPTASSSAPPTTPSTSRHERLEPDLDLMAEAGFTVIRVGESVWSTWEPDDGALRPRLARSRCSTAPTSAASRSSSARPTYAVPPWLRAAYPEIAGERAHRASRSPWGARQEVDYTHPAFRFHAERVIRADRRPLRRPPRGDRLPGRQRARASMLFHNHGVFQRFVDALRHQYGDVETLNREWGLIYWSHRLSDWADLWTPDGNTQPQYDLAWRRFQADQTTEFIAWQADIVREYARPEQFVTTCIAYAASGARRRRAHGVARRHRAATPTTRCRTHLDAARRPRAAWPQLDDPGVCGAAAPGATACTRRGRRRSS